MSQVEGERGARETLGAYRIIAELARGGMAAVFLAVSEVPSGPLGAGRARELVAIKQIHPHLAHDPDFVAMLIDEARLASKIHHPNVVEIRDYALGDADGKNYIVMEYADGESLALLLKHAVQRAQRLGPGLVASIIADTAAALHAAHELKGPDGQFLGLVHRDVSPQNVMLTYGGRVKLTDFGVAKAVGRLQRTQPGEIKGKLAYMAPEQAYGREVDRRSDVYSLGVVLYELALGRRLFGGKTDAETVRNVMEHKVVRPREIDPEFPEALEQVVLAMLAQDPAERFQTAGAVERALRALAVSEGTGETIAERLGLFVRGLEPERYEAKRRLIAQYFGASQEPAVHGGESVQGAHAAMATVDPPTIVDAGRNKRLATRPPAQRPQRVGVSGAVEDDAELARTTVSTRPLVQSGSVGPRVETEVQQTVQQEVSVEMLRRMSQAPGAIGASVAEPVVGVTKPRWHTWLLWVAIVLGLLVLAAASVVVVVLLG